jgi:membrane-associated phospholipid phosphatase
VPTWLFPFERELLWRRRRRAAIVILLAFLLVLLLDRTLFNSFVVAPVPAPPPPDAPAAARALYADQHERYELAVRTLESRDFYRTFRVAGTLWPWLLVCSALIAHALSTFPRQRRLAGAAAMILISAALSGLAAEFLRALIGRLRPNAADPPGTHRFRPLFEGFRDPSDLGFPSSHAAVAFGAAFMVAFVWPRAGCIALLAAIGCGITRMLAGAHFASDIFAAALLGYAVARLLRPGGWRGLNPRPVLA